MPWIGSPDSQARKSWLGCEIWITEQEVMARVGRTRIVMHGRLPRGMSALDRELACILAGLGVWIDIDSKRAGYMGCVCTLFGISNLPSMLVLYVVQYMVASHH